MLLASREEVASCGVTATDMVLVHLQAVVNADTGGPDEIARIESARLGMEACCVNHRVQVVIQMGDALRQESVYVIQSGGARIALYLNALLEPPSLQISLAEIAPQELLKLRLVKRSACYARKDSILPRAEQPQSQHAGHAPIIHIHMFPAARVLPTARVMWDTHSLLGRACVGRAFQARTKMLRGAWDVRRAHMAHSRPQ